MLIIANHLDLGANSREFVEKKSIDSTVERR